MEMIRKYIKRDPLYNPSMKWRYSYTDGSWVTSGTTYIPKPQELVRKYVNIQNAKKYPIWA
jgi:hypothetical protein